MISLLKHPAVFPGGLRLKAHKSQSLGEPVRQIPLPAVLTVALSQHIGETAEPVVSVGDKVLRGQTIGRSLSYISAPVHAPSSGEIIDIGDYRIPHPSGMKGPCVVIRTDGEDRSTDAGLQLDSVMHAQPAEIRQKVRDAGIVGLGGAGFPTAIKLNPGPDRTVELLLINAAECEPYISCDEALILSYPQRVIRGIQIIRHALQARQVVIGIEDNMTDAIEQLHKSLGEMNETAITVATVPARYPAGGEKQLIYALTGEEVPSQGLPIDIGIVCHNVGTAAAVAQALLEDEPLISRIVTVTGDGISNPANLEVRIGTPAADLVEACGGYTDKVSRLLLGGPMMGFALQTDALPITKTSNCLVAASAGEIPEPAPASACIRCGKCAEVCPARLLPQQLYWYAHARDFDRTQDYRLFDCIECGCCAQVCPSHIPLVQYYRFAKTEIWDQERARARSDAARQRHEFQLERLEREKKELEQRRAKAKKALNRPKVGNVDARKAEIDAALARVKAKKASQSGTTRNTENLSPEQQARITTVNKRRAKQEKARQQDS